MDNPYRVKFSDSSWHLYHDDQLFLTAESPQVLIKNLSMMILAANSADQENPQQDGEETASEQPVGQAATDSEIQQGINLLMGKH